MPDKPDPSAVIPVSSYTCEYDSPIECLYSGGAWPSSDYTFTDDEWAEFTLALYMDIHRRAGEGFWTFQFNPGGRSWPFVPFHNENYYHRKEYDTPFWDHYGAYTSNVCFKDATCHNRNDLNYLPQGMWSAAANEGRVGAEFIANEWKKDQYGHPASPEVLYWVGQGVDLYNTYNFHSSP